MKKAIILFGLMILMSFSVMANISIQEEQINIERREDDILKNITIINSGNSSANVSFTSSLSKDSIDVPIEINNTVIAANSSKNVSFTIPYSYDYSHGDYTGQISAGNDSVNLSVKQLPIVIEIQEGWTYISNPVKESMPKSELLNQCPGLNNTDFEELEAGKGYDVYNYELCSVNFSGTPYMVLNKTFEPGTHSIGSTYVGINKTEFEEKCSIVNLTGRNNKTTTNPTFLNPGRGYVLEVDHSCNIADEANINWETKYNSISLLQGESGQTNFTIENTGNRHLNLSINVSEFKNEYYYFNDSTLSTNQEDVMIGELITGIVNFDIPVNQKPGVYNGFLILESDNDTEITEISLEVIGIQKELGVSYSTPSGLQGEEINSTMTLKNNGNVAFDVSFNNNLVLNNGNESLTAVFNETDYTLDVNEEADVLVSYNTDFNTIPGLYEGNLTIDYNGQERNVTLGVNVIEINDNVTVTLSDYEVTEGNDDSKHVTVKNNGNVDIDNINLNVDLSLPYTLEESVINLTAGETRNLDLNISTSVGDKGSYNGNITTIYNSETVETLFDVTVNERIGDIEIKHNSVTVLEEEKATVRFNVTNIGDVPLTINVTSTNLTSGSNVLDSEETYSNVNLAVNETSLYETVVIPSEAGTYTAETKVVYQNKEITQTLTLNVEAISEDLSYTTSANVEWINDLMKATKDVVELKNNGNVDMDISLNISSIDNIAISDTSFTLKSNESKNITLMAYDINLTEGTYGGNLNVEYNNNTAQVPITLTVRNAIKSTSLPDEITISGNILDSTQTTTFTIKNTGDLSEQYNLSNDFNATLNPTVVNLNSGDSKNVELTVDIPEDEQTGKHKIGNIYVNNDAIPVYLNPNSGLIIKELKIKIDGKREELNDGDTHPEEAQPGDTIELEIEVENLLDIEMRDVFIEFEIEDIDEGDDLELETDEEDIDENDDHEFEASFEVPKLVDEREYEIWIHVEGEDEDDNIHEIDWVVYFEVEKENHEILIDRVSISPSSVTCTRHSTIELKVINTGADDEDVEVTVSSNSLDLDSRKTFELEEGDDDDSERVVSFSVNIPEDSEGRHDIDVRVYRDDKLEESEVLTLDVNKCQLEQEEEEGSIEIEYTDQQPPAKVEPAGFESIRESDLYLPALGVVAAGAFVALMALIPK